MDSEEWKQWRNYFPKIRNWLSPDALRARQPNRRQCLEALESRAFSFNRQQAESFKTYLSLLTFHKLQGCEIELIIRIFLQMQSGGNQEIVVTDMERRLLKTAEKKSSVAEGYLRPFRQLVYKD